MKTCCDCKISKDRSEFYRTKLHKDGLHYNCKDCTRIKSAASWKKNGHKWKKANREWLKRNRDKRQIYDLTQRLRRKYKMTIDDYNLMVYDQSGKCLICNKIPAKKLAVDHCHTTGDVRGLLCDRCNQGLGSFKDNITSLKNAIKYLKKG